MAFCFLFNASSITNYVDLLGTGPEGGAGEYAGPGVRLCAGALHGLVLQPQALHHTHIQVAAWDGTSASLFYYLPTCSVTKPGHFGRSRFEGPSLAPTYMKKKKFLTLFSSCIPTLIKVKL